MTTYCEDSPTLRVGDMQVTALLDGWLSLDGGAMFGIVPKVLWEQQLAADSRNRVRMAMRPLLVRTPTHTILVEAGIGHGIAPELHDRYGVQRVAGLLPDLLRAQGVAPEQVDVVVCTHLHWDHSGGLCRFENGRYVPNFPRARHVFQRGEWEIATKPTNLHRASYTPASLEPLAAAGLLSLVEGDAVVAPGLRYAFTNGHTENHAVIWLESAGQSACFLGDLVPTIAHGPPAWISAYDINAGGSFRAREALYPRLADSRALCLFYHEPAFPAARLTREGSKFRMVALGG
ncbi:MAG: MBL fold metallo-hydrolase [Planctomycetes bacterium]|nr:MBL fold metallo-hydrolase [Planctomycetota bacterium]